LKNKTESNNTNIVTQIYETEIKPQWEMNPETTANICDKCLFRITGSTPKGEDTISFFDTGRCNACGKEGEVINPFLFNHFKKKGISGLEVWEVLGGDRTYRGNYEKKRD